MTTKELAEISGLTKWGVIYWCKKNGIKRKLGVNGIMEYNLTDKDIEKFNNRSTTPGKKKDKPCKKKTTRKSN